MSSTFTLLAIHGRYAGALQFEKLKAFLPENISFQAIDLPGFGNVKDIQIKNKARDYSNYLHSVIAQLPQPVVLLGFDIGCNVALEYCQTYQSFLAGLILHSLPKEVFTQSIWDELIQPITSAKELISISPSANGQAFNNYKQLFISEGKACNKEANKLKTVFNNSWFKTLNQLDIPTTLLYGGKDKAPTNEESNLLSKILPNQISKTIPNWGFFPMIDLPGDYAQEVLSFAEQFTKPLCV